MTPLKLGVIGLSPGNGHPYSWSAIFNGYNTIEMEQCGFPVIPRYLEKQEFPRDAIQEASVTHVWSQDRSISVHIAKSAKIDYVVERYTDMIGVVDGILLARDDAETHYEFAKPFLNAGIPIYIDKPLAYTVFEAKRLINQQQYSGQIFSCSALRYAKEFKLTESESTQIGRIRHIHAVVPKDWDKYSVHAIEPLLLLVCDRGKIVNTRVSHNNDTTTLAVKYSGGLEVLVSSMGLSSAPLALRVMGDKGWKDLFFKNPFFAFKSSLYEFVQGIIHKDVRIKEEFMLEVITLIEAGRKVGS